MSGVASDKCVGAYVCMYECMCAFIYVACLYMCNCIIFNCVYCIHVHACAHARMNVLYIIRLLDVKDPNNGITE